MRPITFCLVATILLLATGVPSFAGEESGAQPGCQSTCATCEAHVAPSTLVKGYGPKGGPMGRQIVAPYLDTYSAAYLAPTSGVFNSAPNMDTKRQGRWPAQAVSQEQTPAAAVAGCDTQVPGLARGPKGGHLIPKGASELQALQAIAAKCRIACQ